jgi:hypothetical protein
LKIRRDDSLNVSELSVAELAQRLPKSEDPIAREPVMGIEPLAADIHELGFSKRLQVERCVSHGHSALCGKLFNGSFTLGQQFQQFQTPTAGQRFAYACELFEKLVLEDPLPYRVHVIKYSIIYLNSQMW